MKHLVRKISALVLIAVLVSASLLVCVAFAESAANFDYKGKNKMAFFLPLTGDMMQYGTRIMHGAQLALEQFNAANGTEFTIEFNDDKNDPTESVNMANKIVADEDVFVGMGSFTSSCAMAAAPVFVENDLLLVSATASHTDFPGMGDMVFSCVISQKYEGAEFANRAFELFGAKKLAIIYQNTDQGVQASGLFKKQWESLGGETVAYESFVAGETKDFTPILAKIKELKPDILYVSASYADAAQTFLQANTLDMNVQYIGPGMCVTEEFLKIVGDQINGAVILSSTPCFLPSVIENSDIDEATRKFIDDYKAAFDGEIPNGFSAQGFDAVNIVLSSALKAGSTDSRAIADQIAALRDYAGLSGFNMHFNENKEMIKGIYVFKVEDGNFYLH